MAQKKTTVGKIDQQVLAYTAGRDIELDRALIRIDCIGTAAHVTMLSKMDLENPILTPSERDQIITQLVEIMGQAEAGRFNIRLSDQDVHLAVERTLTKTLGDIGKKTHTGRSRNDQVAVDLKLYSKEQLLCILDETLALAQVLIRFENSISACPWGRTHMQPGMPSSVGQATAHAESLLMMR